MLNFSIATLGSFRIAVVLSLPLLTLGVSGFKEMLLGIVSVFKVEACTMTSNT